MSPHVYIGMSAYLCYSFAIICMNFFSQCVQKGSGVPAAHKPAQSVRTEASVINITGLASVLQGSWEDCVRTVSISSVSCFGFHSNVLNSDPAVEDGVAVIR